MRGEGSAQHRRPGREAWRGPSPAPLTGLLPLFAKVQTSVVCGLELSLVHTRDELGASLEGTEASGWGPVPLPGTPSGLPQCVWGWDLQAPQPFCPDS